MDVMSHSHFCKHKAMESQNFIHVKSGYQELLTREYQNPSTHHKALTSPTSARKNTKTELMLQVLQSDGFLYPYCCRHKAIIKAQPTFGSPSRNIHCSLAMSLQPPTTIKEETKELKNLPILLSKHLEYAPQQCNQWLRRVLPASGFASNLLQSLQSIDGYQNFHLSQKAQFLRYWHLPERAKASGFLKSNLH